MNNYLNKIVILGVLLCVVLSMLFVVSIKIFTGVMILCIIVFLISRIGDIKMLSFLKHFGKKKGKDAANATRRTIARLDKEGYSEAVLGEMQEQLEEFGLELIEARKRAKKEQTEYVDVQKLYDQRLAAAESIKKAVDEGDTSKEPSLLKLVELLESTATSVETEKSEAVFWEDHLNTIQKRYDQAVSDLKGARSKISQGMAKMEQAEIKESQAKIKSEEMKKASGLSSSMSGLDAALGALNEATEKAENKAETANLSLETFKSSNIEEEDDVIKQAMAAASGEPTTTSISDRLKNLK